MAGGPYPPEPPRQVAPRQARHQRSIGGQKVIARQIARPRPNHALEGQIARRGQHIAGCEETDFDRIGNLLVAVASPANLGADARGGSQLFAQLARQSRARRLAGAQFPSGEFPLKLKGISSAALADQQPSLPLDDGCHDTNQSGRSRRTLPSSAEIYYSAATVRVLELRAGRTAGILDNMYSPAVQDHYKHPRNQGELPEATARVEVTNPVCGDTLELAVRLENGRITTARFRTRGCPPAIACSSLLTELLLGKTLPEIREITAEQISQALGGLPPATRHASQLAEDSLDALLDKL